MKKLFVFCISMALISYSSSAAPVAGFSKNDSLIILSTPGLNDLAIKWADEYNKAFPGEKIMVKSIPGSGITDDMLKAGNIAIMSGKDMGRATETALKITIARDVIVPVINSANPYISEISSKGISVATMASVFNNDVPSKWSDILHGNQDRQVNFYFLDDPAIMDGIEAFLGIDENKIKGKMAENSAELLSAIINDPYSIGFCRLINIQNTNNISIMPIDRNGNGTIDSNENIYTDLDSFERGVWIGKYPNALFTNIYTVSDGTPENENATSFLKWVLAGGQEFLYSNGYSELLLSEKMSGASRLSETQITEAASTESKSVFVTVGIFIVSVILLGFLADYGIRAMKRKPAAKVMKPAPSGALDEGSLVLPNGVYFDKTHTWAFMEQNGSVKVGIDDFLQHFTGAINRIKMKNEGVRVKKGDEILSVIQNGKQLNLYSPVTGIIKEKNRILENNASVINSSPYNEGWVYRIEPENWQRENQLLFMSEKHRKFILDEIARIKDFLAGLANAGEAKYAAVILQDGGMLHDGTLSKMGPEVWEEFQTKFIDPSRQVWFYEIF